MALILAIEPDRRQAAQLSSLVRTRVRADLVLAETTEGALGAIGNRVPDLILVPMFLAPQDDAALAGALRVIATAAHVNMLTIPVLADTVEPPKPAGGLFARFRKQPEHVATGCDPSVFAEQIKAYLADAAAQDEEEEEDFEEQRIQEFAEQPVQEIEAKTYKGFPEIRDARELRRMLEGGPSPAARPVVAPPPVVEPEPTFVAQPAVSEPPAVVERPRLIEPPPAVLEPEGDSEEPVVIEPHRLVAPAFVRRRPAAEKPAVEQSFVKPVVKPVDQPIVRPPVVVEPPVVVPPIIERPVEEPVAYEPPPQAAYAKPIDSPPLQVLAEQVIEPIEQSVAQEIRDIAPAIEDIAPVIELVTPVIEEIAPAIEDATPTIAAAAPPPIERVAQVVEPLALVIERPVVRPVEETVEEEEDPIVLAIKHYVPKPLPETPPAPRARRAPEPVQEPKRQPDAKPIRQPDPKPVREHAPEPVRETTFKEIVAAPGLTQSDLDMLYFVEKGTLPPAAPPPKRKKQQRPDWGQLVAAVRVDVERIRAEGTEPAKRGQSGVRQAVGSTPPPRKAPKPIQDQWGLFDPEQCGFAALLAKLDEITETPEDAAKV